MNFTSSTLVIYEFHEQHPSDLLEITRWAYFLRNIGYDDYQRSKKYNYRTGEESRCVGLSPGRHGDPHPDDRSIVSQIFFPSEKSCNALPRHCRPIWRHQHNDYPIPRFDDMRDYTWRLVMSRDLPSFCTPTVPEPLALIFTGHYAT